MNRHSTQTYSISCKFKHLFGMRLIVINYLTALIVFIFIVDLLEKHMPKTSPDTERYIINAHIIMINLQSKLHGIQVCLCLWPTLRPSKTHFCFSS